MRDPKGKAIPCEFCYDLRFKGRVGIFEMLTVDAEVRQTMDAAKPLNQAFRKQRGRYLQEEGAGSCRKGRDQRAGGFARFEACCRSQTGNGSGGETQGGGRAGRAESEITVIHHARLTVT